MQMRELRSAGGTRCWAAFIAATVYVVGCNASLACGSAPTAAHSVAHPLRNEGPEREYDANAQERRPWTVADSIGVEYVLDDPEQLGPGLWGTDPLDNVQLVSPDGTTFLYVTRYGDLGSDSNIYTIRFYSTSRISMAVAVSRPGTKQPAPLPDTALTLHSRSPVGGGLTSIRWRDDSLAVLLICEDKDLVLQGFQFDIRSERLEQVTFSTKDIVSFERKANAVIYSVEQTRLPAQYPILVQYRDDQGDFIGQENVPAAVVSYAQSEGGQVQELGEIGANYWLSDDGRKAVITTTSETGEPSRSSSMDVQSRIDYRIVDIEKGDPPRSIDARRADDVEFEGVSEGAWWSNSGDDVVLTNVVRPTDRAAPDKCCEGYIAAFNIRNGSWQYLERLREPRSADTSHRLSRQVRDIAWLRRGIELLITHETAGRISGGNVYRLEGGRWIRRVVDATFVLQSSTEKQATHLDLEVEQGANLPPKVLASGVENKALLLSPNRSLRYVQRLEQRTFTWKEGEQAVTGGLTLPAHTSSSGTVPLVIQVYRHTPRVFLPDGQNSSVDATQALAAKGMAVLQIDLPWESLDSADEGPRFIERVESAVRELSANGIIDPSRVGIVGFSRAGYNTFYAITHPNTVRLAAVVCADSWTGSYPSYLVDRGRRGLYEAYERMNGGRFWRNEAAWLTRDVLFNVHRVMTPALFTRHGIDDRDYNARMTQGAFLLNNKPIEYTFFPEGLHQLRNPRQRYSAMSLVVDWMSFWLQGSEGAATVNDTFCARADVRSVKGNYLGLADERDSYGSIRPWYWLDCTPEGIQEARAEREAMYVRWRKLREMQNEVMRTPPPPKGKWVFVPENESAQRSAPALH